MPITLDVSEKCPPFSGEQWGSAHLHQCSVERSPLFGGQWRSALLHWPNYIGQYCTFFAMVISVVPFVFLVFVKVIFYIRSL